MADKVREQRAKARERRRSVAAKPSEELGEGATNGAESTLTPLGAAKGVAATAAAAAIAGALAGAAKAWRDRESAPAERPEQDEADDEPREAEAEQQVQDDEPTVAEPDDDDQDDDDEQEPQTVPPAAEAEAPADDEEADDDEDEPTAAEAERDEEPEASGEQDGARGGSPGDATRVVEQAREHLKDLFGADAESVSGIERSNGNWSVTLEVVEMRRIPESTDILSSYTAVLDDDGGIVSLTRGRRYRRSQVEEG